MTMTPQEILLKAADHIEQYGLAKGTWVHFVGDKHLEECPSCAGGALTVVASGGGETSPSLYRGENREVLDQAMSMLVDHLGLDHEADWQSLDYIIRWSDSSTQKEVVRTMRAAASKP
jgi:hypothetical protein